MKKTIGLIMLVAMLMAGTIIMANDSKVKDNPPVGKFKACDNTRGGGFFWVDTTSGKIWRAEFKLPKIVWVYIGQVGDGEIGKIGTYVPHPNKNGSGLFVLNTVTGDGWYITGNEWTKGKKYKPLGKPECPKM